MNQITTNIEAERIERIANNQEEIEGHLSDSVKLAMASGAEFNAQKADLKQHLENWRTNGKPDGQEPLGFIAWCDLNRAQTNVPMRTTQKYTNLDDNRELLNNAPPGAHFTSMRNALKYVTNFKKQQRLNAMTSEEILAAEIKRQEKAAAKVIQESEVKKPIQDLPEITPEEFVKKVSAYIPKEQVAKITEKIGNIPNPNQQVYLQSKNIINAEMADLGKVDNKKVMGAVSRIVEAQSIAFGELMRDKPKYHQAATEQLKKATDDMKQKTKELNKDNVQLEVGSMTKEEYKLIRGCLHPDREATRERKVKAFKIFDRITAKSFLK